MDTYYIDVPYRVKLYDVDLNKNLTPASFFRILQETAGEHHVATRNTSILDSYLQGYSWILVRAKYRFSRLPRYQESITIRTWLSDIQRIKAIREYQVFDKSGQLIGSAKKLWAFFSVEKLRPAAIPEEVFKGWPTHSSTTLEFARNFSTELEDIDYQVQLRVRRSDLDYNQHVNNIFYVQWVREVLPVKMENNGVIEMESKFLAESKFGHILTLKRSKIAADGTFKYEIFNETTQKKVFFAWVKLNRQAE